MRVVHAIVTFAFPRGRPRNPGTAARFALTGLFLLASLLTGACASAPPRVARPLHPITEARAADLIARTFRDEGIAPEADRYLGVRGDRRLRVEVAAAGRKFGVAYLTEEDWRGFGDALPPRAQDDSLVIAPMEGGNHVLLLWASDYMEDDLSGDAHNPTTLAADLRLQRDVRDFLHRAQSQGWP